MSIRERAAKTSLASPTSSELQREGSEACLPSPKPGVTGASLIAGQVPVVQVTSSGYQAVPHGPLEVIDSRILTCYYAAVTNVLCQAHLFSLQLIHENDAMREMIESSYKEFQAIDCWLSNLDPCEIRASSNAGIYRKIREAWLPQVKDWRMILNERRMVPEPRRKRI